MGVKSSNIVRSCNPIMTHYYVEILRKKYLNLNFIITIRLDDIRETNEASDPCFRQIKIHYKFFTIF